MTALTELIELIVCLRKHYLTIKKVASCDDALDNTIEKLDEIIQILTMVKAMKTANMGERCYDDKAFPLECG